jgi:hypothetical protein
MTRSSPEIGKKNGVRTLQLTHSPTKPDHDLYVIKEHKYTGLSAIVLTLLSTYQ